MYGIQVKRWNLSETDSIEGEIGDSRSEITEKERENRKKRLNNWNSKEKSTSTLK